MIQQRNFVTMILLSIVTCGIYGIYFWYKYSEDMNTVCAGDGDETQSYIIVILLSIVTCGIYGWIWYYKLGNRLQANAPRYGLAFQENGTTILLWMLLGSFVAGLGTFVAWYFLVRNMNSLAGAYNNYVSQYNHQAQQPQQPQQPQY